MIFLSNLLSSWYRDMCKLPSWPTAFLTHLNNFVTVAFFRDDPSVIICAHHLLLLSMCSGPRFFMCSVKYGCLVSGVCCACLSFQGEEGGRDTWVLDSGWLKKVIFDSTCKSPENGKWKCVVRSNFSCSYTRSTRPQSVQHILGLSGSGAG